MPTKKCPAGQILRKSYTKTTRNSKSKSPKKITVRSSCIKDQGSKGKSKPTYRKSPRTHTKCPSGQVARASYTRKSYTKASGKKVSASKVSETCIKDVGSKGKGPILLPELDKKLVLRDFGYSLSKPSKERHTALGNAVREKDKNTVIWHLNYLRNISAYKDNKDKFSKDMKYVQSLA
jgi:hypothetical protein